MSYQSSAHLGAAGIDAATSSRPGFAPGSERQHQTGAPSPSPVPTIAVRVGSSLAQAERQLIFATLEHCGRNKTAAAQMLGVSLKTLYNRLNEYNEASHPVTSMASSAGAPMVRRPESKHKQRIHSYG